MKWTGREFPLLGVHDMANQVKFRVLRISKDLQASLAGIREARSETNATVIANSVMNHLPALVASLEVLGFSSGTGKKKAVCWPIAEETLAARRTHQHIHEIL